MQAAGTAPPAPIMEQWMQVHACAGSATATAHAIPAAAAAAAPPGPSTIAYTGLHPDADMHAHAHAHAYHQRMWQQHHSQHAAAGIAALQHQVMSQHAAQTHGSGTAHLAGHADATCSSLDIPLQYTRDPWSGRLKAILSGPTDPMLVDRAAAVALYGEAGRWIDPGSLEKSLAESAHWRKNGLAAKYDAKMVAQQKERKLARKKAAYLAG